MLAASVPNIAADTWAEKGCTTICMCRQVIPDMSLIVTQVAKAKAKADADAMSHSVMEASLYDAEQRALSSMEQLADTRAGRAAAEATTSAVKVELAAAEQQLSGAEKEHRRATAYAKEKLVALEESLLSAESRHTQAVHEVEEKLTTAQAHASAAEVEAVQARAAAEIATQGVQVCHPAKLTCMY